MEKNEEKHARRYKTLLNFALAGVVILLAAAVYGFFRLPARPATTIITVATPIPTVLQSQKDYLSYRGETGVDALTLLKRHSLIMQDRTGMVVQIVGRQAEASKHEYWAFYVNGKLAMVGPASYKTKSSDLIEWRIAHY